MTGWAKDQGTTGSMLQLLGDPRSEFTKALGLVFDDPGAMAVLGNPRCKRFSMFVDDGIIKTLTVAEGDVPAEDTFVDKVLEGVKGAGAALQYPMPAMRGSTATNAIGAKQTSFAAAQAPQRLPQPLRTYKPVAPSFVGSPVGAAHRLTRPLYEEASSISSSSLALIGLMVGSGVTFAVLRFRRMARTMVKEPLLENQ